MSQTKEEFKTIKKVRGEYSVILSSTSLTGRQAMELAREDAKRKALEQAFGSRITIWDKLEISSSGETFGTTAINEVSGEIVEFIILEEGDVKSDVRSVETIFYCVANVKVKKGIKSDPNFVANIEGIKKVYYENDMLEFSINAHQNCYLKIFLLTDFGTGYLIYPNAMEKSVQFEKDRIYSFPLNKNSEYVISKDTEQLIEVNRLVFVFTKEEKVFYDSMTSKTEIEQWIASIPNNEKFLHLSAFDIRKK